MVSIFPLEIGPLRHVQKFSKSIGGAQSNVAIGLLRVSALRGGSKCSLKP